MIVNRKTVETEIAIVQAVAYRVGANNCTLVGLAGQVCYMVAVTYPGEPVKRVSFIGNVYGGPVYMFAGDGSQGVLVHNASRFGDFSAAWVEAFFGETHV